MTRRKLILHGPLRELCPDGLTLETETVGEAINGMCRILKLRPDLWHGRQRIKVLGCDSVESILKPNDMEELHIVPAFTGGGGVIKIIIGAVLVVVGVITGQGWLIEIGASMVIGGLINVLFPTKTAGSGTSNYLGAPGNTTRIGTRIPLILGTCAVYGQYLSYNIDALAS